MLTGDAGRIMDDGTVARLDDETFYVTTTSTGADAVYQWFTWWNAVWFMDVRFVQLTGAVAAINVAGPRARELMTRVSRGRLLQRGHRVPRRQARRGRRGTVPRTAHRLRRRTRLRAPLPSPHAEHVWDTLLEKGADLGAAPFGLEPQRILRLEKGHVIVSQDTDSESNLLEAAMPWIVKNDKEFEWVGKWATQQVADRGLRWMLVGFESPSGVIPVEGGQVIVDGVSAGRVTSVRRSDALGKVIGLAIVPHELAARGRRGSSCRSTVGRSRCASTSARSSTPPARGSRRDRRTRLPLAVARAGRRTASTRSRARLPSGSSAPHEATFAERDGWLVATPVPGEDEHLARVGIADLSHLGTLDIRPAPAADLQGDGVTTYRLSPRRALVLYPQAARSAVGEQVAGGRARRRRDRAPTPSSP